MHFNNFYVLLISFYVLYLYGCIIVIYVNYGFLCKKLISLKLIFIAHYKRQQLWEAHAVLFLSSLYVCMVNTIYLFSFVKTPRKFIIAELSIRKLGSSSFSANNKD